MLLKKTQNTCKYDYAKQQQQILFCMCVCGGLSALRMHWRPELGCCKYNEKQLCHIVPPTVEQHTAVAHQ